MRWQSLFDDLEGQLAAQESAELRAEVSERTRSEQSAVRLADRLRAAPGAGLVLYLRDGSTVRGTCRGAGADYLLVDEGTTSWLVAHEALTAVAGLTRSVAPPAGVVLGRLGLASALRGLAQGRVGVRLRCDGAEATGTIDRVGADHLDLAEHPLGEARRPEAVRRVLTVPFGKLLAVEMARLP